MAAIFQIKRGSTQASLTDGELYLHYDKGTLQISSGSDTPLDLLPLNKQIAGGHYKKFVIQPIEFITKNNLPFIEGNIIKYICRWQDKGGVQDLDKVIHYVELLKELKT